MTTRRPGLAGSIGAGALLSPVSDTRSPVKSILRDSSRISTKLTTAVAVDSLSRGQQIKRKISDSGVSDDDDDDEEEAEASPRKKRRHEKEAQTQSDDGVSSSASESDNESDYGDTANNGNDSNNNNNAAGKPQKSVHFDMSLNITTELGGHSFDDIKRTVRRALEAHATGDDQDFADLQDIFARDREQYLDPVDEEEDDDYVRPEDLVLYVIALTGCTPMLNKSCQSLIQEILKCSWLGRDDKFFRAYVQFLAALISAQGVYMRPILEMIVNKFKEPRSVSWTVPDLPSVDRETVQNRLHFGLQYILKLFPAARPAVCRLISQKFPFSGESKSVHLFYLDNMLRLREYSPNLGPELLETATSQLVKMDTEFQLDLSDMDDDLVARVLFQLASKNNNDGGAVDEDDENDDDDSEADESDIPGYGDPDYDEDASRIDRSTKLVQKLDLMLDRLFALFAPIFEDPDSDPARACLEDMISDFANFVLTVPSSRHTQFLLFHFSQRSLGLQDIFTGTLLNLGFESNRSVAVRQAAAAYLSSYVARAARVPRETVRNVTSVLCHRIESFRRSNGERCCGPDLRRYQELYSWVQALLYIFCFRWRDLVEGFPDLVDPEDPATFVGQELDWMAGLKQALTSIIYSSFNPLLICSPPIVAEFAKLAFSLQFMYVFPRLEANKRVQLSQFVSGRYGVGDALREDADYTSTAGAGMGGGGSAEEKWLQLEGHFPFDPYHLPVSKRWLEGDYVSWTPIPGIGGSGGRADDEDDESEDAADDDHDGGDEEDGDDRNLDLDSDYEEGLRLEEPSSGEGFEEDTATDLEGDV